MKAFLKYVSSWPVLMTVYVALMLVALTQCAHAQDTGYFAQKTYTSSGAATYAVPFPYLHQVDVQVLDNGVAYVGTVTWTNSTTISLSPVITTGHTVVVKRVTPTTPAIAVFNGGAIASTDLNRNQTQALYVGQEAWDRTATAVNAGTAASTSAAAAATSATAASSSASGAATSATSAAASATAAATFVPSLYSLKAGVTDGSNAAAGAKGEFVCAQVTNGGSPSGCQTNTSTPVSLTSGTSANVTSLSLTAGDWSVCGYVLFNPAGTTTITSILSGLSLGSGTFSPSLASAQTTIIQATLTTGAVQALPVTCQRFNFTVTTPVYLVAQSSFGTSTMTTLGYAWARRMS